ncbi:MAG: hypothetical protein JXA94_07575 [Parachlamydiales bacterium]|nr:hypothetical protein [Parachlamydiales bacterium]
MNTEKKRLFFAFDICAFWIDFPKENKIIQEQNRHITLLFLGENNIEDVIQYLNEISKLPSIIGPICEFDKLLFLPEKHPRLVAFNVNFLEKEKEMENFQKRLVSFFKEKDFEIKHRDNFKAHITVCRNSFNIENWKNSFRKAPLYIKSFNLFESLGNSEYRSLWNKDFLAPFEEIRHTADIAFIIKGENFLDLLFHAFIALSFNSLDFFKYKDLLLKEVKNIDDVIINLNEIITQAEIDGIHLPFKAVSFHSDIFEKDKILNWEMIVDV